MEKITTPDLKTVNISSLDILERRWLDKFTTGGMTKEEALQVIINTTEGDFSQLSEELQERALRDNSWK